jgi:hypothetical protein
MPDLLDLVTQRSDPFQDGAVHDEQGEHSQHDTYRASGRNNHTLQLGDFCRLSALGGG